MSSDTEAAVGAASTDASAERAELARAGSAATPPPATGHADVDAALDGLTNLDHLTPREQVSRYAEVHGALQETLRTIDAA